MPSVWILKDTLNVLVQFGTIFMKYWFVSYEENSFVSYKTYPEIKKKKKKFGCLYDIIANMK